MKQVVFLLEEPSMKEFLDAFLPRMLPGLEFLCVKHEGKKDLEKSIPRKLRAWSDVSFIVVRDNDGADCRKVKSHLKELCRKNGHPETLVRIACQELEAWYLGEPQALAAAYSQPELSNLGCKAKYRDPDSLGRPSEELSRLIPEFRKREAARRMGGQMTTTEEGNSSRSFRIFVRGVRRVAGKCPV